MTTLKKNLDFYEACLSNYWRRPKAFDFFKKLLDSEEYKAKQKLYPKEEYPYLYQMKFRRYDPLIEDKGELIKCFNQE